ncbi:MAG: glycoside hydrolase [Armatimonadetes bacterium]|nr:glycoside hydrolase [Armatimonadota bacterium]
MRRGSLQRWLPGALVVAAVLGVAWRLASETTHTIAVDQAGYAIGEQKLAYVFGRTGQFAVVRADGRVAFRGTLGGARFAADVGQVCAPAEFTSLDQPGTYFIRLSDGSRSPTFRIAARPHAPVLAQVVRAFTTQRCGTAVRTGLPQDHPACHLQDGVLWTDPRQHVPTPGGWHDAGDYGKYTVNGAYAAGLLLLAAERLSAKAGDQADALRAEAHWEIEWLLTIQAPDGSAYHKVTARKHPGVVPAEGDNSTRYLFPASSTGTGDLAAALAIAARAYRKEDASLAGRCLAAAERAWQWLAAHPEPRLFRNPEGVNTGTYGDKGDADERLWAAVELARATGKPAYWEAARALAERRRPFFTYAGSWADVANLAALSLLTDDGLAPADPLRGRLESELVRFARKLADRCAQHPLRVVLQPRDYYWGSNGVVLNYAMLLLAGGRLAGDESLTQAGRDQVHYLLGRNALGLSFVTGVGENAVRNPHHAPSMLARDRPAVPGLLVGGPNAREGRALSPHPATCYADVADNWTVNEPAINLNAELAFVLALAGS